MRFGLQTICWGRQIDDIESLLYDTAVAGFQGIEFAQTPASLGVTSVDELLRLLRKYSLDLIGLAGGSLVERIEFCDGFRPSYLYIEQWDSSCDAATSAGFQLAVHPHLFKPIFRLGEARTLLENHPTLQFILDSAHLSIAGEDIDEAYATTKGRLAALHAKDWTPIYGRHSHRYAKGFTELGRGVYSGNVKSLIQNLRSDHFEGWIVWEQDFSLGEPAKSAMTSADWLRRHTHMPKRIRPKNQPTPLAQRSNQGSMRSTHLVEMLRAGNKSPRFCYDYVAKSARETLSADFATVWRCTSSQSSMSLLSCDPEVDVRSKTLCYGEMLCEKAILRQHPTIFYAKDIAPTSEHHEFMNRHGIQSVLSVPVYNPWNLNHVIMVLNLYYRAEYPPIQETSEQITDISNQIAFAVDTAIGESCAKASGTAAYWASQAASSDELLDSVRAVVRSSVGCEGLSLFIIDDTETRLYAVSNETEWTVGPEEQYYELGEGLTGRIAAMQEPFHTSNTKAEEGWIGKSTEKNAANHQMCLLFPLLRPAGKLLGILRCSDKRVTTGNSSFHFAPFSEDDIAMLDGISSAIVPHLERLLAHERRARSVSFLTHELKVPVVAIRGAAEAMSNTPGVENVFRCDYPGNIWSWSELMRRLLSNLDASREEELSVQRERTLIMRDVVAPAVNQCELLLEEHGLPTDRIIYGKLIDVPTINVDKNMFQQVAFNLISNAIKHGYDGATGRFKVCVSGNASRNSVQIHFEDTGPGFEQGMQEAVFNEGVRGRFPLERGTKGDGVGLWVVRRIVEAHGGTVRVTSIRNPTRITILLPASTLAFTHRA